MNSYHIVDCNENYKEAYKNLNIEWLEKYFVVEDIDFEMLSNPQTFTIDKGGFIYILLKNEVPIGTVSLIKTKDGSFEMSKMAISPIERGQGLGQMLITFCIEEAKKMNLRKISLFSNTILQSAIHLYKKNGFVEIPVGDSIYKRSNIKMELVLKNELKPHK
jgi:ribosomal protein S18 acetylase RimI-like enzyme